MNEGESSGEERRGGEEETRQIVTKTPALLEKAYKKQNLSNCLACCLTHRLFLYQWWNIHTSSSQVALVIQYQPPVMQESFEVLLLLCYESDS